MVRRIKAWYNEKAYDEKNFGMKIRFGVSAGTVTGGDCIVSIQIIQSYIT